MGPLAERLMALARSRPAAVAVRDARGRVVRWGEIERWAARAVPARDGVRRVPVRPRLGAAVRLCAAWRRGEVAIAVPPPGDPAREAALRWRGEGGGREQPAAVLFSSGTTGRPRAVVHTASSLLASARAVNARLGAGPGAVWLCPLPLQHVGALAVLVRAIVGGYAAELHERFDAQAVVRALASGRVTHVSLVGRMLERLLEHRVPWRPASSLRAVVVGGGPVDPDLVRRARRRGIPVCLTYGCTEAGSQITTQAPGETGLDLGRPIDGVQLRVGDNGSLWVRGPVLAAGLGGGDGWYDTGDLGTLGAGARLLALERRVDLIVSGGKNVRPVRVERVLEACPAVREAAVLGWPDRSWGERVVAVVRRAEPVERERLERWCAERLAVWERPRSWVWVDEPLPRTALGKLRRAELRRRLERRGLRAVEDER
ncbi:MAG: o-succinylbenzoate--CoA ligase [Planctomycetota bacterium]|nr:MAG: o-succinylbenzoate--CoA ligase [Planctomycetota bacterium]